MKENYLDKKPKLSSSLNYTVSDEGIVTLGIENKGLMNKIAQKLFKRPKVSYVHLDELGSFALKFADGEKTIFEIGQRVEERFGEKSHPLYERLAKFFQVMDSYHFLEWK